MIDAAKDLQLPPVRNDSMIGTVIYDRYEVVELIGIGGMGRVYRALQRNALGREVAIKLLHVPLLENDIIGRRFENEARIIASLRHPNTLKLIEYGRLPDHRLYLVSERLYGHSLHDLMIDGPLSISRTLKILEQVADALSEAHAAGIVHRDLKPANIFIEIVGDQEFAKVLDFGIAKLVNCPGLTAPRQLCGTPGYMSPEQAIGREVDYRSDFYALGVIAYECLAGCSLFIGDSPLAIILRQVHEDTEPLEVRAPHLRITRELSDLIARLMSRDPAKRPRSTAEIRAALQRLRRWYESEERVVAEEAPTQFEEAATDRSFNDGTDTHSDAQVRFDDASTVSRPAMDPVSDTEPTVVNEAKEEARIIVGTPLVCEVRPPPRPNTPPQKNIVASEDPPRKRSHTLLERKALVPVLALAVLFAFAAFLSVQARTGWRSEVQSDQPTAELSVDTATTMSRARTEPSGP